MSVLGTVGKRLDAVVSLPDDRVVARSSIDATDLNGERHRYDVTVFDRDGDGRADAIRSVGGRTHDRFGRPDAATPRTHVSLIDVQLGRISAKVTAAEDGRVTRASEMSWTSADHGVSRSESDRNGDGRVDGRSEIDVRPPGEGDDWVRARDGLGFEYEALGAACGYEPHIVGSRMAFSEDENGNGVIEDGEVHYAKLRLPPGSPDLEAEAAVKKRLARGWDET